MLDETPSIPSPYYLDVILRGAVQSGLPEGYIQKLRGTEHNGYTGGCSIHEKCIALMPTSEQGKCEVAVLTS